MKAREEAGWKPERAERGTTGEVEKVACGGSSCDSSFVTSSCTPLFPRSGAPRLWEWPSLAGACLLSWRRWDYSPLLQSCAQVASGSLWA